MNMMAMLLNLIIFTISIVKPIKESSTSQNIGEISQKLKNVNGEDTLTAMHPGDILRASEMYEDSAKKFFMNLRYSQESEATDENSKVSSEKNTATASSLIKLRINNVDENNPILESEFRAVNEKENKKNGENKPNTNNEDFRRKEKADDLIENKEGTDQNVESNENKSDWLKTDISSNDSDNISAKVDNNSRKPNDKSNYEWDDVNTRRMNIDLNDNDSTLYKKLGSLNRNAANPEQKNVGNSKEKDITRSEVQDEKNFEENNSDNYNNVKGTRSEEKNVIRSKQNGVESSKEKEKNAAKENILTSTQIPEYISRVKNSDGKKNINLPYEGIKHYIAVPALTAQREDSYNPIAFNTQNDNPIDLNNVPGYTNILGHSRLMPFTRHNNILSSDESRPEIKESRVLTIDDFNSEQYANAYPYTPAMSRKSHQESLPNQHYNSVFLKLRQASEDSRKDHLSAEYANLNKAFYNSYRPNIVIPSKYGLYKIINVKK